MRWSVPSSLEPQPNSPSTSPMPYIFLFRAKGRKAKRKGWTLFLPDDYNPMYFPMNVSD